MVQSHESGLLAADLKRVMALESVPPVDTRYWVPRRKAQVVKAVQADLLSVEEVCRMYRLTDEEFKGWQQAFLDSGEDGLRVTRRIRARWERLTARSGWGIGVRGHG